MSSYRNDPTWKSGRDLFVREFRPGDLLSVDELFDLRMEGIRIMHEVEREFEDALARVDDQDA